jgi:Co/Zn/Cd efflux system component
MRAKNNTHSLMKTTFFIAKMDCSAEEQMVRMRLADRKDVQHLDFILSERRLSVYHTGNRIDIGSDLKSLGLGMEEIEHAAVTSLPEGATNRAVEKSALLAALAINAILFAGEFIAGVLADSLGLVADSLDMLADAFVYSLSLLAVGGTTSKKHQIARWSGYCQFGLAVLGIIEVGRRFVSGEVIPDVATMIVVATLALAGNLATLSILAKSRSKEAHMQASWIFTSNDIKVNLLVIMSGVLVSIVDSGIPDLVVGGIIFIIVARGARQILALSKAKR